MLLFSFLLLLLSFYASLLLFSWDHTAWRQRPFLFPFSLCLQNCQGSGVERSATCLCQGPKGNYFKLCRPCGLCRQLSLPFGHEGRFRPYMNEWAWPCSNKTLSMDMDTWISCNFYTSQNSLLFIFFPTIFKCKNYSQLTSHYQTRQQAGFGPRAVVCWPLVW